MRFVLGVLVLTGSFCSAGLGSTLYGVGRSLGVENLYTVDQSTGAVTLIGPTGGASTSDLASDTRPGSFRLWGTDQGKLISINPATGAGSVVGTFNTPPGNPISTLSFDSITAKMYGTDGLNRVFLIDPQSANVTLIATNSTTVAHNSLGFDNNGNQYTVDALGDPRDLYRVNTATGAFEFVAHTNIPTGVGGIPFIDLATRPEDGVTFGMLNGSIFEDLYTVDLSNGNAVKVGSNRTNQQIFGLAFSPAVPEPTSLCILATVATLFAATRRARYCRNPCSACSA